MIGSSSPNKVIMLESELGDKAESIAWSNGEGDSSSLPPNDKTRFRDKMLGEEPMDDMIDRSSLNKVIMVDGVMADKPGHLDNIDHPQCDVSPEQSRRKDMKASIQGAEEGYDLIQIVKSSDNIRCDTKENGCFSWFIMLMGTPMGNHKFRGAPGRRYRETRRTNGMQKPGLIASTCGKWAHVTPNQILVNIVPISKACRLTDSNRKRERNDGELPDIPPLSEDQSADLVGKPLDFHESRRSQKLRAVELIEEINS
jgi:hypothetical protein